jgi:hypothetical protein
MSDDLGFDGTDDELQRRFAASSTPERDADAVLGALRPRFERARTRRRVGFVSATVGVAAVVVALVFALGPTGGDGGSVRVPPATRGPMSTAPPSPTATTGAGGGATPTTVGNGGDDQPASTTPTANTEPPAPEPSTPTAATPERTESFSSDGGTITVQQRNGQVSLLSASATAGFATEVHDNGPTRVEVRFTNGNTEWRIRVDLVDDNLVPEVSQH